MECPYCNKSECEPRVVERNVEAYGSRLCRFKCFHCGKVVSAYGHRTVIFSDVKQTTKKSDW